jgi:hypothetical protein
MKTGHVFNSAFVCEFELLPILMPLCIDISQARAMTASVVAE